MQAFNSLREEAEENGVSGISLGQINKKWK
jgi:hypothetical protein